MASVQTAAGGPVFKEETGKDPYMVAIHNGYYKAKHKGTADIYMNYGVRLLDILNHIAGKTSSPSETINYGWLAYQTLMRVWEQYSQG